MTGSSTEHNGRRLEGHGEEEGHNRSRAGEEGRQDFHAFGGLGLDDVDIRDGGSVSRIRIYVIYGRAGTDALYKARGGIDDKRCAYDYKDIGLMDKLDGLLNVRHRLLEKYDMRTHGIPVSATCGRGGLKMVYVKILYIIGIRDGTDLHEFSVEVEHILGTGTFMKVIDILSDYIHVVILLKLDEGEMSGVGPGIDKLTASIVIETVYQCGIATESIGGSHLHDGIILPKSVGITKCLYS